MLLVRWFGSPGALASLLLPGLAGAADAALITASTCEPHARLASSPTIVWPESRTPNDGTVEVEMMVQPDGSISGVRVLSVSGHPPVDALLSAISEWKFAPVAQACWATMKINFEFPNL